MLELVIWHAIATTHSTSTAMIIDQDGKEDARGEEGSNSQLEEEVGFYVHHSFKIV